MTKPVAAATTVPLRFGGQSFVLAGLSHYSRSQISELIACEGGTVVKEVTRSLDFLITGKVSSSAAEKKARRLIQKQGAAIRVLDEEEFVNLCTPAREQLLALLHEPEGWRRWNALRRGPFAPPIDLSGADLRGITLVWTRVHNVTLDGADLGGADLSYTFFEKLDGVRLEKAKLAGAYLRQARGSCFDGAYLQRAQLQESVTDCGFVGADLEAVNAFGADLSRCDFTRARLPRFAASRARGPATIWTGADLTEANLSQGQWQDADFSQANLGRCLLEDADLQRAKLTGANLGQAILTRARLDDADLTGADLRGSNLTGAVLTGARVVGARFEGACLTDACLDGVDVGSAVGLGGGPGPSGGKVGPVLKEFDRIFPQCGRMEMHATIDLPQGPIQLQVWGHGGSYGYLSLLAFHDQTRIHESAPTPSAALFERTRRWSHGRLRTDLVTGVLRQGPLKPKAFQQLVLQAWCEAFGVAVPSEQELQQRAAARKAKKDQEREQLLAELRSGPEGVARWNKLTHDERRKGGTFADTDLSGLALDGADLCGLDFEKANFTGAALAGAMLRYGKFPHAIFARANLRGAQCETANFTAADFQGAVLERTVFEGAVLRNANFRDADLTDANCTHTDLRGADLSKARLKGTQFTGARYDAATRFPPRWKPHQDMRWAGKGVNPHLARTATPPADLDLDAFLRRLAKNTEPTRLQKALAMLKAERFQLFVQADEQTLVGVVKSQSNPDPVYSCRLAADGGFACCTRNLNVCGGLRGKLCKHLLVLIVGLAKKGQLDLGRVDQWVTASGQQRPRLEREAMSETLLRYKAAEAGEIDWRPTETIPEDFYAC